MKNMKLIALALFLGLSSSAQAAAPAGLPQEFLGQQPGLGSHTEIPRAQKNAADVLAQMPMGFLRLLVYSPFIGYEFFRHNRDVSALSPSKARDLRWGSAGNFFHNAYRVLSSAVQIVGNNGQGFILDALVKGAVISNAIMTLKTRKFTKLRRNERLAFVAYQKKMSREEKKELKDLQKRLRVLGNATASVFTASRLVGPSPLASFLLIAYNGLFTYFRMKQTDYIRSVLEKAKKAGLLKVDEEDVEAVRAEDSADEDFEV